MGRAMCVTGHTKTQALAARRSAAALHSLAPLSPRSPPVPAPAAPPKLPRAQDEVHAAVGEHRLAQLPHRQRPGRLLKGPLHLAAREPAQVAPTLRAAAANGRAGAAQPGRRTGRREKQSGAPAPDSSLLRRPCWARHPGWPTCCSGSPGRPAPQTRPAPTPAAPGTAGSWPVPPPAAQHSTAAECAASRVALRSRLAPHRRLLSVAAPLCTARRRERLRRPRPPARSALAGPRGPPPRSQPSQPSPRTLERVTTSSFQDEGRRTSRCLTSR